MKNTILLLLFIGILFSAYCSSSGKEKLEDNQVAAQSEVVTGDTLKQKPVLSGKATMLIPSQFSLMSSEMLNLKYPSKGHQPSEVYTNNEGTINIALNHTQNKAGEENLAEVKKAMEGQFNRPPINFIKSEIREINGSKVIVMEFVSPAADTMIYNLMVITSLEGRLIMITFNCTESHRKEWEPIGKRIIESIKVK